MLSFSPPRLNSAFKLVISSSFPLICYSHISDVTSHHPEQTGGLHLREEAALVPHPELLTTVQNTSFSITVSCTLSTLPANGHPILLVLQRVVGQRLVCPGVVLGSGQVDRHQYRHRPVESVPSAGRALAAHKYTRFQTVGAHLKSEFLAFFRLSRSTVSSLYLYNFFSVLVPFKKIYCNEEELCCFFNFLV